MSRMRHPNLVRHRQPQVHQTYMRGWSVQAPNLALLTHCCCRRLLPRWPQVSFMGLCTLPPCILTGEQPVPHVQLLQ